MLKVDRQNRTFRKLDTTSLDVAKWTERYDLQQMIVRCDAEFFGEIGERLLLLGEEVRPSTVVDDRIDLLALDQQGTAVVIELKRGSHKLQLLQSLSYAAMISTWTPEDLIALRAKLTGRSVEDVNAELTDFLLEEHEAINARQRVILVAEAFDYSVLATAEWLTEKYNGDVRCHKLVVTVDGANEYLGCVRVYPPSDIDQEAVVRGKSSLATATKPSKWASWEEAIAAIANPAVRDFFRGEIDAGRDSYLRKRIIRYHLNGRRPWWMSARNDLAYVWQKGRFMGDLEFWRQRLSDPNDVGEVKEGSCLRLFLRTADDFAAFGKAMAVAGTFAFLTTADNSAADGSEGETIDEK